MKEQQNLASKFECLSWRRASRFDTSRILDPKIRRQLGRILEQGKCGLGDAKYLEVSSIYWQRINMLNIQAYTSIWEGFEARIFIVRRIIRDVREWLKILRKHKFFSISSNQFWKFRLTFYVSHNSCQNYTHLTTDCTHVFYLLVLKRTSDVYVVARLFILCFQSKLAVLFRSLMW